MAEEERVKEPAKLGRAIRSWLVPTLILFMAAGIVFLVAGNWITWASDRGTQKTNDAYTRADLTPLSTKVTGLVATVAVSDYQTVKAGDLLVQLRDDDFRAQVRQAEAGVEGAEGALTNNQRQKELQDARILQAGENVQATETQIKVAEAGIEAANASIAGARGAVEASKAEVERTTLELRRQEALIASKSATRQELEQAIANQRQFAGTLAGSEAEVRTAMAQLASRQADLVSARAKLRSVAAELEAQKRQRAVLDSQGLQLRADRNSKRAALSLAMWSRGVTRWFRWSLSVADPFVCRCLTNSILLRFHTPLIEPDGRD